MLEESEEGSQCYGRGGGSSKSSEFGGKVVSTLDGSIWSRCSIAQTCPAKSHFQLTQNKDGARVGMNVTAHQEKGKNEETKTGKRGAGEKKK